MYQMSCENNTESIALESTDEYIISVSWNSGSLAAAYFKMNSMELYLMQETIDLKPHFSLLHNLFRQLNGIYIIASGPREFLLEVMTIIGLPSGSDPNDYRVGHTTNQSISTTSFLVYGNDSKTLLSNRQRIMALKLPGMLENSTDFNRTLFIESVLPIHQSMVLQSIGNLLKYLDANWCHLFLRNDTQPIIVDVKVYRMEKQILMDRETFHALHIFSPIEHHPSSFIKGTITDCKEGFSLFAIMNTCYSKIGKNMLKLFLNQPLCDIVELNLRHSIIRWCLRQQNDDIFMKLKRIFKNLCNIGVIFIKLKTQNSKPIYWKLFRNSIYSVNIICEICLKIKQSGETDDFINELSDWVTKHNRIKIMLSTIENIIDIDESIKQRRFIVKYGVDQELDNKKNSVAIIFSEIYEKSRNIVNNMPSFILAFNVIHIAEFGFVIALKSWGPKPTPTSLANDLINYIFQSNNTCYYKLAQCDELNDNYNNLNENIYAGEHLICERLLQFIQDNITHFQTVTNLCAKFDCMMAMARFAKKYCLIKPILIDPITTTSELSTSKCQKYFEIHNGRHLLIEMNNDNQCIPNNTLCNVNDKNLITILNAPNSTGKSIYLKQVGIIAYLAHIGSYVPADCTKITLLDAIYTRIYSPESIFQGNSGFLIELKQMSWLITNSTNRSLILIDEFGKGTNIAEGKALLTACIQNLAERKEASPITIISTHYSDVYNILPSKLKEWISLQTFEIKKNVEGIIFSTFKLINGKNQCNEFALKCQYVNKFLSDICHDKPLNVEINAENTQSSTDKTLKEKINFILNLLKEYLYMDSVDVNNFLHGLNRLND